MSVRNSAAGAKPPQPTPRVHRSTLLLQSSENITVQNDGAMASSSELCMGQSTDIIKMNAEICRYRKALKDSGGLSADHPQSSVDSALSDDHVSIDSLKKRLQEVMEKNDQWQVYDNQREDYVKSLHLKYHELHCRFQNLSANFHEVTSNPSSLSREQRQYYDQLLVQARQERSSQQNEIMLLKTEMENMKVKFIADLKNSNSKANHWKTLYENQMKSQDTLMKEQMLLQNRAELTVVDKENWDRVSVLQREMELHRKDFSLERSKREGIERRLEKLQKQLTYKENPRKMSTNQGSRVQIQDAHSKPKSSVSIEKHHSPSKLKKLSKVERHIIQNDRRSHPIDLSHVTTRKQKSSKNRDQSKPEHDRLNNTYSEFSHHEDSNLSCPNCGKIYAVDEHEFLLSHIDLCI